MFVGVFVGGVMYVLANAVTCVYEYGHISTHIHTHTHTYTQPSG